MSNPDQYGDMIIEFNVEYPQALNTDQKLYIKEALINYHSNKKPAQHQQHQPQQRKKSVDDDD